MTAGNNGTPENGEDDPFGYLYRGEGEQAAPTERPGVPRTSYHQVSRVGERRGAPPQQSGYGYPQQPPPQYGQQPQAPYGQQPQQPYGQPSQQPYGQQPGQGRAPQQGGGRAADRAAGTPNHRGLMIGAIAVVVVVAVGIGIAFATDGNGSKKPSAGSSSPSVASSSPTPSASAATNPDAGLPKAFGATLTLGGKAAVAGTDQGAQGPNGSYVTMPNVGDSATWNATVPTAGTYRLYIGYDNPGQPATATLTVNGTAQSRPINLDNFTHSSDPAHAWTQTWQLVQVKQGANTLVISCAQGDQCAFDLDRVWLQTN